MLKATKAWGLLAQVSHKHYQAAVNNMLFYLHNRRWKQQPVHDIDTHNQIFLSFWNIFAKLFTQYACSSKMEMYNVWKIRILYDNFQTALVPNRSVEMGR